MVQLQREVQAMRAARERESEELVKAMARANSLEQVTHPKAYPCSPSPRYVGQTGLPLGVVLLAHFAFRVDSARGV